MPEKQETRFQSPGGEDPLENTMAAYSVILFWKIPRTEEPSGLQSMGFTKSQTWLSMHARILPKGSVPFLLCFIYNCICLFINLFMFDCAGSLLLHGLFSTCAEQGLLASCDIWASHCGGFSCCWAWALGFMPFSSCGSWALEHRLKSCGARV